MRKSISESPSIRYNRSMFDLSHSVKTTLPFGKLVPIDWQEVLPGDTFKTKIPFVARVSSSFVKPIIDNIFIDTYTFFVPLRLVDDKAQEIFGVPQPNSWTQNLRHTVPRITSGSIASRSVGDYLGLPVATMFTQAGSDVMIYPFRAFALIYNYHFRDENNVQETYVYTDGIFHTQEAPNNSPWSTTNYTGQLPNVKKKRDYFTTSLPQPQKGPPVSVPLAGGGAPVYLENNSATTPFLSGDTFSLLNSSIPPNSSQELFLRAQSGATNLPTGNLYADLTNVTAATINDWRFAFQLQKMLERDAQYGSYYSQYVYGHFGETYPDFINYPEFLGGSSTPVNVQQVAQTSQSTEDSPLANVAGYSLSNGYSRYTKSFTEHGILMTVACVRQIHSYQQGIAKKWIRRTREDFYDPLFATLGEQAVYSSEIYNAPALPTNSRGTVFGYQEPFVEYRFQPNMITGQLRSGPSVVNSLSMWHLGDYYSSQPYLNKQFIEENSSNLNRVLSVETTEEDPFILDFYFKMTAVRVLPTFGVPGLIDHH